MCTGACELQSKYSTLKCSLQHLLSQVLVTTHIDKHKTFDSVFSKITCHMWTLLHGKPVQEGQYNKEATHLEWHHPGASVTVPSVPGARPHNCFSPWHLKTALCFRMRPTWIFCDVYCCRHEATFNWGKRGIKKYSMVHLKKNFMSYELMKSVSLFKSYLSFTVAKRKKLSCLGLHFN